MVQHDIATDKRCFRVIAFFLSLFIHFTLGRKSPLGLGNPIIKHFSAVKIVCSCRVFPNRFVFDDRCTCACACAFAYVDNVDARKMRMWTTEMTKTTKSKIISKGIGPQRHK
jgi:hypothetical protein